CQRGRAGEPGVPRVVAGGGLGVEVGVGAWWATLRESGPVLAPACQLQKRCHRDYWPSRGCDKSRGSTGRSRSASEGFSALPSLARRVSIRKPAKLSCRGNNGPAGSKFTLVPNPFPGGGPSKLNRVADSNSAFMCHDSAAG